MTANTLLLAGIIEWYLSLHKQLLPFWKSVEEMHVAVENECEKSNGETAPNAAVDKLTTDKAAVEKEQTEGAEIFTNLNGVKGSLDVVPAAENDEPAQNISSVIKEQEKVEENNLDQKKEQHESDKDNETVEKIDEKPTSNGLSHSGGDEIEEEEGADQSTVRDEPSPSSQPATGDKEQSPEASTASESNEQGSVVDSKAPTPEPEQKDSQSETIGCQSETPNVEEPVAKPPIVESDEKMETDCEENVDQNGQKSPGIRPEAAEEKMETEEEKSDLLPEKVPSPVKKSEPSQAAPVEKTQEAVTDGKASSPEATPVSPIIAAEKESAKEEVVDPDDEMDTTDDVETVIKTEDNRNVKPIVDEPKLDITIPIVEIKIVEPANKEKESEVKIKLIEETVPEVKIEKKSELAKEPVAKETTPATASVKRKAADTGDEPEQDRDGGVISSSSSNCSGSEADNTQDCKRIRFDESIFEEDERERLIREFVERSTETSDDIGKNCDKLQHEIAALSDLARAKELEWNSIMRLLKLKEEMLERILFKKRHLDCQSKPELDVNLNKMYKNFVTSSTTSTDQIKSNRSETSTPTNINNHVTVTPISSSMSQSAATTAAAAASASAAANMAALNALNSTASQDFYGSGALGVKSTSAMNSSLNSDASGGKFRPQHRPILPKPPQSSAAAAQAAAAQSSSHLAHTLHAVQQAAAAQQQAVSAIQPPHSSSPQQQQQQQQQIHQQQQQAQANMMQSNAAAAAAAAASMLADQNSIIGEGRQGAILDVKSIIADFRSKNPDSLPRRGRRNVPPFGNRGPQDGGPGPRFLANSSLLSMANIALGSGSHIRTSVSSTTHNDHRPNSYMIGQDNSVPTSMGRTEMQMRHPTIDSLMLSVNHAAAAAAAASCNSSQPNSTNSSNSNNSQNDFFRETLVKMAKMSEKRGDMSNATALHMGGNNKGGGGSHLPPPPPYPEVTLHPVLVPQSSGSPPVQNSLLHGILTKSNAAAAAAAAQAASNQHHPSSTVGNAGSVGNASVGNIQHRPTTFSPTLARLLTAPERSRGHRGNMGSSGRTTKLTLNEILNSKKTRTEVTITPVTTSTSCVTKNGSDVVLDDDDESEVADRLVIDEGREVAAKSASNVIPADQVPECQGCHKKAAQFVCAGCGNQWYCSRECQVQAWEDHSEMCSG